MFRPLPIVVVSCVLLAACFDYGGQSGGGGGRGGAPDGGFDSDGGMLNPDGGGMGVTGTGSGSLGGALAFPVRSATARFSRGQDGGPPAEGGFSVYMFDEPAQCPSAQPASVGFNMIQILMEFATGGATTVGTYQLDALTSGAGTYLWVASVSQTGGIMEHGQGSSGNVTITHIEPGLIEGNFTATIQPTDGGTPSQLTGQFSAPNCD